MSASSKKELRVRRLGRECSSRGDFVALDGLSVFFMAFGGEPPQTR